MSSLYHEKNYRSLCIHNHFTVSDIYFAQLTFGQNLLTENEEREHGIASILHLVVYYLYIVHFV